MAVRPVVFDLDQTLIRGEVQDWELWLACVDRALGITVPRDEDWAALPVHTDHGLLHALSWKYRGRPFTAAERAPFEADVVAHTERLLAREPDAFAPIPGAQAAVRHFAGRACLATGNLHVITVRKLAAAGLHTPAMPCSCSAEGIDRTELVARALRRIGWTDGAPATSLGDGNWDIVAARALGVGFVGVAHSDAHEARLRAAGARVVLRDYLDLEAVVDAIDTAPPPDPA